MLKIQGIAGPAYTRYCYDGDQVIAHYNNSGTLVRKFIYGPGIDKPIMMIVVAGETKTQYYYHFDGLGSVIALSNVNSQIVERYSYDVFGQPSNVSSVGNPYLFTGRYYDSETGNYYYRARYYSPKIGRFLQTDPIGYADSMNLYSYVLNNPINFVDPYGLDRWGAFWSLVGGTGWDTDVKLSAADNLVLLKGFPGAYTLTGVASDTILFDSWAAGIGPDNWVFGPGSIEVENMRNAPGLEQARKEFHESGKTSGGTDFGLKGAFNAGFNPTQQFVGSFYWQIIKRNDGTKRIILRNRTSVTSGSYKQLPSHTRSQFGPCGDMWQTYWWIENVNR